MGIPYLRDSRSNYLQKQVYHDEIFRDKQGKLALPVIHRPQSVWMNISS